VLRLKHLLFVEGLTLAGARRRLEEERVPLPALDEPELAGDRPEKRGKAQPDATLRRHLIEIRQGLQSLLAVLDRKDASFELRPQPHPPATARPKAAQKGNGRAAGHRAEPRSRGSRRSR
jgi:hypothetical protein